MALIVDKEGSEQALPSPTNLEHLLGIFQIRKADYHPDLPRPVTGLLCISEGF